jgi:hypothetical protein
MQHQVPEEDVKFSEDAEEDCPKDTVELLLLVLILAVDGGEEKLAP